MESIYVVTGYIPSDEPKVSIDIFCLIKTKRGVCWISCTNNYMIGGSTDYPEYDSSEEALVKIHGFLHDKSKFIMTKHFEHVIEVYENMKSDLTNQLNAQLPQT